jgi:hypothetical protein
MALIIKGSRKNPTPPPKPPDFTAPGSKWTGYKWEKGVYRPKGGWDKDALSRMNPVIDFSPYEINYTRTEKDQDPKDEEADEAKKKARVAAIIAANRAKRKSRGNKTSNVSGTGTVSPLLYSYPGTALGESTGGGFSLSDIPSIVWIVLAVAGGIFLIKSARKR